MARAIVMGNFDGVHLGHQSLFSHARSVAKTVIALTFEPHPKGQGRGRLGALSCA